MSEKMRKLRDTFTASYTEGLKDESEKMDLLNDKEFQNHIEELAELVSERKPSERKRLQTIGYINYFCLRTVYLDDGSISDKVSIPKNIEIVGRKISESQVEMMVEDGEITWEEAEKQYEIVNVNDYMHHGRNQNGGF